MLKKNCLKTNFKFNELYIEYIFFALIIFEEYKLCLYGNRNRYANVTLKNI